MKILLINPNRYTEPPVPPLGLEYLVGSLAGSGHQSRLLDLTFSRDPSRDITEAVKDYAPDLAGVTVRNIDNGAAYNSLFFLDEIAGYVRLVTELGVASVAGGAGFSFAPREILAYLDARWGIEGPGEGALAGLLGCLERGDIPPPGTVLNGWETATSLADNHQVARSSTGIDYPRYLAVGAVGGFRTQTGCRGACPFCAEAGRRVTFHDPQAVIRELEQMVDMGVRNFHLCDSEFNQVLEYCHTLLEAIQRAGLKLDWALYMKAAPFDYSLFRELAAAGATLVTFTYPSGVPDEPVQAVRVIRLARSAGIRVAVDYLCGFPGQGEDEVARELDSLRAAAPDTVGVSNCIRLYPNTPVSRRVCGDTSLRNGLLGEVDGNPGLLRPVYYSGIPLERIREMVAGEPLFKIEGFERSNNYQRLSN